MTADLAAPGFFISVGPPAPGAGGRADSATQVDQSVRVISLKFEDDEQKPDKLTLTVDNHDLSHLDSPLWRKGNVVEFQFGYPGRMSPPRTAVIQSVKGFSRLTVEAQSGDTLMNRVARPDRVFEQKKRSDVVREIVKEYGYRDDELDIEDTEVVHEQVTQGPLTDRQFIRQLAWREGFEFFIDFDGVHFHKRRRDQQPIKTYRYFTERGRGEMLGEPTIEDDISGGRGRKVGAIVMKGRDPSTGKPFEVRADNTTVAGRPTLMPTMTVHEVLVLDGTGEPRTEYRPLEVNGTEKVVAATETTEEGAKRQAAAHFEKHQMRAVKMGFNAVGDPNVVAKSVIKVEGIGETFSGLWYARNVTHELTPGTEVYKMALKLSTDGVNSGAGGGGGGGGAGGTPAGPPADGAPNGGGGSGGGGDDGEMEEVLVVDGTGEPRTEYRDRRGRSGSGS